MLKDVELAIAYFPGGVTSRDHAAGVRNALGEIDRGAAVFEALDEGVVVLDHLFPVDDGSHSTILEVTRSGRGLLHMIERGPTSVWRRDQGRTVPGGKVIPVNDPGVIYAISKTEVDPRGRLTGRDRVFALVQVRERPPR